MPPCSHAVALALQRARSEISSPSSIEMLPTGKVGEVVERMIAKRQFSGKEEEYLAKWKWCQFLKNTWVSKSQLRAQHVIQYYEK